MSARTRRLTDAQRADLIGKALMDLQRARFRLQAASCTKAEVALLCVTRQIQEAYQCTSGREQYEIRCTHGTLLSVSCRACECAGKGDSIPPAP